MCKADASVAGLVMFNINEKEKCKKHRTATRGYIFQFDIAVQYVLRFNSARVLA